MHASPALNLKENPRAAMQVRDGMSPMVLTVGPRHTLRAIAKLMSERAVGAAAVMDPEGNRWSFRTYRGAEHSHPH